MCVCHLVCACIVLWLVVFEFEFLGGIPLAVCSARHQSSSPHSNARVLALIIHVLAPCECESASVSALAHGTLMLVVIFQ